MYAGDQTSSTFLFSATPSTAAATPPVSTAPPTHHRDGGQVSVDAGGTDRGGHQPAACRVASTEWSACSKTCDVGHSLRLTNDNEDCLTRIQVKLCHHRPCAVQFPDVSLAAFRNDLDYYSLIKSLESLLEGTERPQHWVSNHQRAAGVDFRPDPGHKSANHVVFGSWTSVGGGEGAKVKQLIVPPSRSWCLIYKTS